mmetsp:Transcript_25276/g.81117  ORF Transcript_25276/g.81117 Transcript_25276/m.81117 type:complete len:210 (+) Transcript_25276:1129-1758(+)
MQVRVGGAGGVDAREAHANGEDARGVERGVRHRLAHPARPKGRERQVKRRALARGEGGGGKVGLPGRLPDGRRRLERELVELPVGGGGDLQPGDARAAERLVNGRRRGEPAIHERDVASKGECAVRRLGDRALRVAAHHDIVDAIPEERVSIEREALRCLGSLLLHVGEAAPEGHSKPPRAICWVGKECEEDEAGEAAAAGPALAVHRQ